MKKAAKKKACEPTNEDRFGWTISEVKKGRITWIGQDDTGIPGTSAILATTPSLPFPVGIVWYRFRDHETIDIMNSWTFAPLRRCGVRSYIHNQMLAIYRDVRFIWSQGATPDGKAWMEATGYKLNRTGWLYRVPKKKVAG